MDKVVLNCLDMVQAGLSPSLEENDQKKLENMELLGAIKAEDNTGMFDILTGVAGMMKGCPFNARYENVGVNPDRLMITMRPIRTDLDWVGIYIQNDVPGWVKSVFYEYLGILKNISNSGPLESSYMKLYTLEQVQEWLNGTSAYDYVGDFLFSKLAKEVFSNTKSQFEDTSYGWNVGPGPIPTFMRILDISDTEITMLPVTSLGSIVLQSAFTLEKKEVADLVLAEKINVWASISNPMMKPMMELMKQMQTKGEN